MTENKSRLVVLEAVTAIVFLLFLFPFFILVINSAKDAFSITQYPMAMPEKWSLIFQNMKKIWTSENIRYPSSFMTSTTVTVLSLIVINTFSSQAAWVLVRNNSRISKIIFLVFVAAMVIPFQIVMFPLLSWYRKIYVVTGIKLLRTQGGLILSYLGFGLSLSIFMFHGFIKSIPYELEEAATIDGCRKDQVFYRIIFPLLTPIHATVMILNGIWIWNDYLLPLLILGKGNKVQTIPLAVANFAGAYVKQWDLILTAILMAIIPIIVFFLFAQKYIIKGMVAGSIKS
ncbi:MAG: carbohydrate ABC transporter permease [Spirochaetes bacterium]|nr:MAG: carbohydrate ABC transporter permease [Spirochaetota bacterium]